MLFTTYQWGKPQVPLAGECGAPPISGGTQISRRKDQAGSLGTEEKIS